MDLDKLAQRVIRPVVESLGLVAGMGFVVASHRIYMNWERMKKLSSASCVMQNRTLPKIVTSRYSIRLSWPR
jgi:hypothetical protein